MLAGLVQGAAFTFAGALLLIIALVLFVLGRFKTRGGVDVNGEVYDHGSYRSRGRLMYFPKYRAVVNGETFTCGSGTATSWKRPPIGTPAKLSYYPANAETPLRERGLPMNILITSIVLVVAGAPFLATGIPSLVAALSSDEPLIAIPGLKTPKAKPGHR